MVKCVSIKVLMCPKWTNGKLMGYGVPIFQHIRASKNYLGHQRIITVKILKFGTPQTIAIIVLKIEKFDVTLH